MYCDVVMLVNCEFRVINPPGKKLYHFVQGYPVFVGHGEELPELINGAQALAGYTREIFPPDGGSPVYHTRIDGTPERIATASKVIMVGQSTYKMM